MFAYIFWHVPFADGNKSEYEAALTAFHRHLANDASQGFKGSATYGISNVAWLSNRTGYEDWYFVDSTSALDGLNKAAVEPERWDVHASVSYKTEFGHGGMYYHLRGEKQPVHGSKIVWLKRPKRIRYETPLQEIIDSSKGFLSCWRKFLVLGPADEFAIIGDETLDVRPPSDWRSLSVSRRRLV